MKSEAYEGTWKLRATASENDQIDVLGGGDETKQRERWFSEHGRRMAGLLEDATGLTLTIGADGRFEEVREGNPEFDWFDAEGVLDSSVTPFDGELRADDDAVYLLPAEPASFAACDVERHGVVLRYSDGDTEISDRIELDGDELVRTVNVMTDGLYLNRVVLVYERG